MKRLVLLSAFLTIFLLGHSQFCPFLGPDQYLPCGVNSTTLTADLSQCGAGSNPNQTTNYNVTQITYAPQVNTGNQLFMGDDTQQGPFNIGFNFCFYGNTYTQFWVGSNGWISFSPGQPTTFTSTPIPSVAFNVPKNCIMGPWQDWHPGLGGQIRYQTSGVAPCRKLTVSWIGVPMFSCTGNQGTFHIVIYESSNIIENYIQNKPACVQWAGGTAVQGIHNLPGNSAVAVPGRNSTAWTTQNNAWQWNPSGPPVVPVLTWYQVGNPASIGTGPTINVTPPPGGANYTCHFVYPTCNAGWASCNVGGGNGPDTVLVVPGPPNLSPPAVLITDPLCDSSCDGEILVTPSGGTAPFTIVWNTLSGFNPIGLCAGTYTYILTDANGCDYSGFATLFSPPPVTISAIIGVDTVCYGSTNEIYQVQPQPGINYVWSTPGLITSGQGTNLITVDWSLAPPGAISPAAQAYAINANGCVSPTVTFDIELFQILPSIDPIGPFCSNDPCVPLSAQPLGGSFTISGVNTQQFCPLFNTSNDTVVYTYTQSGCAFTDTSYAVVNPQPEILDITPPNFFAEICQGDSVSATFLATSTLPGTYTWNGSIQGGDSQEFTWNSFGTFITQVYVTTPEGCVSSAVSVLATIEECPNLVYYIPNSFTPDGNEYNNTWRPIFTKGIDTENFSLYIYNRWGQVIWESHNIYQGWDGTYNNSICPIGVYVYTIDYGSIDSGSRQSVTGHITLLR
jgi:gliding motility-associated-like protein